MREPLIVIAGPTAAGKTALSVQLAQKIGGEIVSADSMQVYRGMDIGTAKVRKEETKGIPHHLIDVLDPRESFNVVRFRRMAKDAIRDIHGRGHVPILTGGTGFYIQAVLYDIDFDADADSAGLRRSLEQDMTEMGPEEMHRRLSLLDPAAAEQIHPNNRKRVIRALEFCMTTGKRISEHNREQRERSSPYDFLYYVLTMDRPALYRRIDARVEKMMEEGLLQEVISLRDQGVSSDMTSMQGLGYRQIYDYLEGIATLPEAVERIQKETRHFAKRQLTWFRREKDVRWIDLSAEGMSAKEILARMTEESLCLLKRN